MFVSYCIGMNYLAFLILVCCFVGCFFKGHLLIDRKFFGPVDRVVAFVKTLQPAGIVSSRENDFPARLGHCVLLGAHSSGTSASVIVAFKNLPLPPWLMALSSSKWASSNSLAS